MLLWLLALPVAGYVGQRAAEARDRRRYPAPGRLVDVDGVRLHTVVSGSGPVVLIDSGLGGSSIEWGGVADLLDGCTVIRYDRPGFGWSPGARCDRSPRAAATRIHGLLRELGVTEPVVLVGHSLGGLHVRLVAQLFPAAAKGLVLVDPSHEDMLDAAPSPKAAQAVTRVLTTVGWLAPFGAARVFGRLYGKVVAAQLRGELDAEGRAASRTSTLLTLCTVRGLRAVAAEMAALPASLRQVQELTRSHPLPAVPLTVITAGAPARTDAEREGRRVIDELHRQQAAGSPLGRVVVAAKSGHLVPVDEPALVASVIRETVHTQETTR